MDSYHDILLELFQNPASLFSILPAELVNMIIKYTKTPADICCGWRNILFITDKSELKITGLSGTNWNIPSAICNGAPNNKLKIKKISFFHTDGVYINSENKLIDIEIKNNQDIYISQINNFDQKIKFITTGSNISYIINKTGQVFSYLAATGEIRKINFETKIKYIVTRPDQTIFLDEYGSLYFKREYLEKFVFPEKIISVATGAEHTIFLTVNYKAYGIGSNQEGQLGIPEKNTNNKQILINLPKIQKIFCGFLYSIFLTLDYQVYFCGNLSDKYYYIPTKIDPLAEKKIIKIAPANSYFILMDSAGQLYYYGYIMNQGFEKSVYLEDLPQVISNIKLFF